MSFRYVTYRDNQDEILPGFLRWIGLAEALEIPDEQLPRLYPSEVDQILGGTTQLFGSNSFGGGSHRTKYPAC